MMGIEYLVFVILRLLILFHYYYFFPFITAHEGDGVMGYNNTNQMK